jgi:pyrimidine-nucleoside phosphorylase
VDSIDPAVGLVIPVKPGDRVEKGEPLASIFARDDQGIAAGLSGLREAIVIGDGGTLNPLITHRVTHQGVETL